MAMGGQCVLRACTPTRICAPGCTTFRAKTPNWNLQHCFWIWSKSDVDNHMINSIISVLCARQVNMADQVCQHGSMIRCTSTSQLCVGVCTPTRICASRTHNFRAKMPSWNPWQVLVQKSDADETVVIWRASHTRGKYAQWAEARARESTSEQCETYRLTDENRITDMTGPAR